MGSPAPPHIQWSFGQGAYANRAGAVSDDFDFRFRPSIARGEYGFRAEVMRACALLDERRKGRPIALCYTGGIDSELIARALAALGIPFELYFLDIWGLNLERFRQDSAGFLAELGKSARIVRLEKAEFYENFSLPYFRRFACDQPTFLALCYLFDRIPKNEFIVAGDGDLHREGELFAKIAAVGRPGERMIPFAYSSVFFYLWQERAARRGEFYFFSSTPELLAAAFQHPLYRAEFPRFCTREMIYAEFPEVARRQKTSNWDSEPARRENKWIRNWLYSQSPSISERRESSQPVGCLVNPDEIFYRG